MQNFDYHRPSSVADAAKALGAASDGKLIAGGQSLLPTMRQRLAARSDVIDLGAIAELKGIKIEGDGITIGATTTHAEVAASADVKKTIPALATLAGGIGDRQVRHRGTIGGSLANNDPAADYPAAALGLGAVIRTNKREIKADDYFKGMFETAKGTPCTHNPLGVKGCGEAGAIGSPPAVINAIAHALGIKDVPMPATPHAVWQLIQNRA